MSKSKPKLPKVKVPRNQPVFHQVEAKPSDIDESLTREEFLRVLGNVSRPSHEKRGQGKSETSE